MVGNQAKFIAKEQKDFLWENGFLGSENGKIISFALVGVFGIQFALRTKQEHRNLGLKNSQFYLEHDKAIFFSCSTRRVLVKLTMGLVPCACQKESCSCIQKFN